MNVDFDQLKIEARERLSLGVAAARRLPGWVWAIPATLVVGFAWAVALCWQPGPKDEASVTVRSIDRQPAATVSIDPTPPGDYIPDSARPSRHRTRRKKKSAEVAAAHAAPKPSEPAVTPITPEAHWMETISAPKEVGALKRRAEPASESSGTGSGGAASGGGAGSGGGTGTGGGDAGAATQ